MPILEVHLFDTKVTLTQRRQLAEALTSIASETLDTSKDEVTIIFRISLGRDVARGGIIGGK